MTNSDPPKNLGISIITISLACQVKMSDAEEVKDEDKEVAKKLGLKIKSYTDIQKYKLDKYVSVPTVTMHYIFLCILIFSGYKLA